MTDPVAALRAVDTLLLAALPDARAIQDEGQEKHRLALGLIAAETQAAKGTQAGCVAAISALAAVQDEAADLDGAHSQHVARCAHAAEQAYAAAKAIDWHVHPPVPVLTVRGFAAASPGDTAVATLVLSAAAATNVTAMVSITGLAAGDLANGLLFFPVQVPAGATTAPLPVAFAAQTLTADKGGSLTLSGAVGATLGTPPGFSFSLSHNSAPLPTLALAGPGDITPSATTQTAAQAVVTLSAPTDHDVTATYALTGQQDGDLASPTAGGLVIPAGASSATIPVLVAPLALTADRPPITLTLSAVAGTQNTPAPVSFVLKANTAVTRGTLTFPSAIGTVVRDHAAETTVSVQVAREGVSTHAAATIPVVNVTLPPAVLKAVGPAVFGAGQRIGYAPMVLKPYGAGLTARPTAARRTPGHAALVATADFDLGAVPNQDFLVQDGPDVVTGPNPFHDRVPAEALQALPFPFGWSMNWAAGDVAAWTALTGRRPYVCSGGSHDGGRIATWDKCMGAAGGQLDYHGTNFAVALAVILRGGGLLVPTWYTSPTSGRGSYASLAGSAAYHDRAASFGRAACAMMVAAGKDPGQLCPRWDKELNQDPARSPNGAGEVPDYAAALATFIQGFNEGYTATQPVKPLHILGLARHDQIGPLEAWVPKDTNGKALVAGIDISAHLPNTANNLASHPVADQAAATRQWLRGGYDGRPSYSHDHADPQFSGKVVCQKYGIAMCHSETSARNEALLACTISAGFWLGMFGFWRENAAMMGPVGVFATSAIKPASIPGWGDGIAMLGRCAQGLA